MTEDEERKVRTALRTAFYMGCAYGMDAAGPKWLDKSPPWEMAALKAEEATFNGMDLARKSQPETEER